MGWEILRAPNIFYTILERGKGKFVRLGDIANIRFGIKTGANEFFYFPNKFFDIKEDGIYYKLLPKLSDLPTNIKIEKEFIKPVIISANRCSSIIVKNNETLGLLIPTDIQNIKNYEVWDYIKWGEKMKFNIRPSTKSRKKWYSLLEKDREPFQIAIPYFFVDRYIVLRGDGKNYANKELFEIKTNQRYIDSIVAYLNSTILPIWLELYSVSNIPSLVKIRVYDVPKIPILYNINLNEQIRNQFFNREIHSIFKEVGIDPNRPIREQEPKPLPDRAELDKIIFDILGLTEEERKEVYWSVCELVKQRLDKAKSLKKREKSGESS